MTGLQITSASLDQPNNALCGGLLRGVNRDTHPPLGRTAGGLPTQSVRLSYLPGHVVNLALCGGLRCGVNRGTDPPPSRVFRFFVTLLQVL